MAKPKAQRPLKNVAEAFQHLAKAVNGLAPGVHLDMASFSRACLLVSPLLGSLGVGFMFVKMEFDQKARDLDVASRVTGTMQDMIEADLQVGKETRVGSHTRNLLLMKRGLDMLGVLLEMVIPLEGNSSLEGPARASYQQVFAPYHALSIRVVVGAGMAALPTKDKMIKRINEDAISARIQMESYIASATPVIQYVESLFVANGLDLDG